MRYLALLTFLLPLAAMAQPYGPGAAPGLPLSGGTVTGGTNIFNTTTGVGLFMQPERAAGEAGAGTSGSPYTNSIDNTAGIKTQITAGATYGVPIYLSIGQYNATTAATVTTSGVSVVGGTAGGKNGGSNGQSEGFAASKIHTGTSGQAAFTLGTNGTTVGALEFRNLYLWGTGTTDGSSAFNVAFQVDTPRYTDLLIGNFQYGILGTGFQDGIYATRVSCLYSAYCFYSGVGGGGFAGGQFVADEVADNTSGGFTDLSAGGGAGGPQILGGLFWRNASANGLTNGANITFSAQYSLASAVDCAYAGNSFLASTQVAADCFYLSGPNLQVTGSNIHANGYGAGVHVSGTSVGAVITDNAFASNGYTSNFTFTSTGTTLTLATDATLPIVSGSWLSYPSHPNAVKLTACSGTVAGSTCTTSSTLSVGATTAGSSFFGTDVLIDAGATGTVLFSPGATYVTDNTTQSTTKASMFWTDATTGTFVMKTAPTGTAGSYFGNVEVRGMGNGATNTALVINDSVNGGQPFQVSSNSDSTLCLKNQGQSNCPLSIFQDNSGVSNVKIGGQGLYVGSTTGSAGAGIINVATSVEINGTPVVSGTFHAVTALTTWADNQTCTAGQFTADASFIYVCTASNTVKRVALSAF